MVKKCENCGKEFVPNNNRHKFCSVPCRTKVYKAAHREYAAKFAREWGEQHPEEVAALNAKKNRNPEYNKLRKEWDNNHKLERKAYYRCNVAIDRGIIKRSLVCEVCGEILYIERHFPNGHYPLWVVWICKKCHKQYHAGRIEIPKKVLLKRAKYIDSEWQIM